MKEANATTFVLPAADRKALPADRENEIRLLDDYELVLAGGGEGDYEWP